MKLSAKWCARALFFCAGLLFTAAPALRAQEREHVVSAQDLQKDVQKAAKTRAAREAAVRELFQSDAAQKALKQAQVDYQKVETAVGQLSDDDLARLAERSRQVQNDFAAGKLTDRDLIIIVVIGLLVILLAVALR